MDVLSHFWSPLCAVGSHGPRGPNAQICVSVLGASIVPDRPRVLVSLSRSNYTCELVREAGTMAITLLSRDQLPLLSKLGLQSGRDTDKLTGLDYGLTDAGDPVFRGGAGFVAGEMIASYELGDATAYLVAVLERDTAEGVAPLRWQDAREIVDAGFLEQWQAKSEREQAVARELMAWR